MMSRRRCSTSSSGPISIAATCFCGPTTCSKRGQKFSRKPAMGHQDDADHGVATGAARSSRHRRSGRTANLRLRATDCRANRNDASATLGRGACRRSRTGDEFGRRDHILALHKNKARPVSLCRSFVIMTGHRSGRRILFRSAAKTSGSDRSGLLLATAIRGRSTPESRGAAYRASGIRSSLGDGIDVDDESEHGGRLGRQRGAMPRPRRSISPARRRRARRAAGRGRPRARRGRRRRGGRSGPRPRHPRSGRSASRLLPAPERPRIRTPCGADQQAGPAWIGRGSCQRAAPAGAR